MVKLKGLKSVMKKLTFFLQSKQNLLGDSFPGLSTSTSRSVCLLLGGAAPTAGSAPAWSVSVEQASSDPHRHRLAARLEPP